MKVLLKVLWFCPFPLSRDFLCKKSKWLSFFTAQFWRHLEMRRLSTTIIRADSENLSKWISPKREISKEDKLLTVSFSHKRLFTLKSWNRLKLKKGRQLYLNSLLDHVINIIWEFELSVVLVHHMLPWLMAWQMLSRFELTPINF